MCIFFYFRRFQNIQNLGIIYQENLQKYSFPKILDFLLRFNIYSVSTYFNLQQPPQWPLYDQTNLSLHHPLTLIDLLWPTVNLLQPPTTSTATSFRPTKPMLASSPVYNWPATTSHDQLSTYYTLSTYFNLGQPLQQQLFMASIPRENSTILTGLLQQFYSWLWK